jgi:hypothetical protein
LSICHLLGVAGSAAAADNPFFIMVGFVAAADYSKSAATVFAAITD